MKKKWLGLLSLLCCGSMAFGLSACSGEGTKKEEWGTVYSFETAYAQAQELGYAGSLEEFIAQISGAKGEQGIQGVQGEKGDSGVGVKKVEVNGEGNLIISLTDDTQINCGKVVGKDGADGVDGKDGVGISSVYFNDKNELVVVYTDETEKVVGTIPACDHIYDEWTVGEQATCTSMGYQYRTCTVCENVEYDFTEKLGHTFNDWQELIDTCTEHWQTRTCQICGNSHSQAVPAKGHLFFNGKCTECDEIDIQNVDLSAFDKYNGTYGYEFLGTMENGEGMQALYKTIDDKVKRFHANTSLDLSTDGVLAEIELSPYGLEGDKAVSVWKTYKDDNPLYYWLSNTISFTNDTIVLLIEEDYLNGRVREYYNQLIEDKVNEYASLWYNGASAYDIALAYHDAILTAIDYSYDQNNKPEDSAWAHNIVGVFNEQGAVCEGYARSFQLLLNYAGVENVFVTGESRRESHAWNLVQLDDGNWYWCDLTWDDTPNWKWGISYNYFLVNDTQNFNFIQSHTYDTSANNDVHFLYDLPARNSEIYTSQEITLSDEISTENMVLQVVGYNALELHAVTAEGAFEIPETITYQDRTYTIISLGSSNILNASISRGKITSLTIPKSVIFIWDHAFVDVNIENIYVAKDNPKFTSKDGVLFTKSLWTLIRYPSANPRTAYVIPEETRELAHRPFEYCKFLEELTLGKNISIIGITNWGDGYHDGNVTGFGGNIITGELYRIRDALTGKQQIHVSKDNASYATYNGAIYNKDLSHIYVFLQPKTIKTVTLSANVISIDTYGSYEGEHSLYILDSLENLESIFVEEGNEYYTIQDGVLYNKEKTEIIHVPKKISGDIVLPDSITSIRAHAFSSYVNLTSVTIGDGATSIGGAAFSGCSSLNNVIIGNSVISIDDHAFYSCSSLTNVIIGNSVTSIEDYAFCNCSSLTSITIPDSVTSIGEWAFYDCDSLTSITIGNGVTSIGQGAFNYCDSLTSIVYQGTKAQWNAISKGSNWASGTGNYIVYCADGNIVK